MMGRFKEDIPLYMVKHQVRPGITGWAQVNDLRGDTSIKERIEHDIYYIENWSLLSSILLVVDPHRAEFVHIKLFFISSDPLYVFYSPVR